MILELSNSFLDVEGQAPLLETHDVKSRPALRQVERDIAGSVAAVADRHANRAERRKRVGG